MGRVHYAPFPYLVIENALPDALYTALAQTRPSPQKILKGRDPGNNLRMDLHASETLDDPEIHPLWRDFVAYHTSHDFWTDCLGVFGEAVQLLYPQLEFDKPLRDATTGVRFRDQADIHMDCNIGVNTPVTAPGRVRGPHLDNPVELIAGLLYMRPPEDEVEGGELDVCRLREPYRMHGKAEIDDKYVEVVGTVPYQANTLVMFVNSAVSIHSVRPRPVNPHHRLLVNFAMEVNKPLFSLPHKGGA